MKLYDSLYYRLKSQHGSLEPIISKTDPMRLYLSPSPGKWSIKDNVAHLSKYQLAFVERIETILNKENPFFERYKAENDPQFENWRKKDITELVTTLHNDRNNIFQLITNLTEEQLSRIGTHKKFGQLTIVDWTEFFLLHEAHHIFTIFQLANDEAF